MRTTVRPELAALATHAGPADERGLEMLRVLRQVVPFDAAWVAVLVGGRYQSFASMGLDRDVVRYLGGPVMARDTELTGTDHRVPPLSPSDLGYPAEDLQTWAECLIPSGLHEALATALYEPDGRHVGFVAVLSADRRGPSRTQRRDLAATTELLARIVDPMVSVTAASRLVDDAVAGVILREDGTVEPVPGLPGSRDLASGSTLLDTLAARLGDDPLPASFLWPCDGGSSGHGYVRVTYLALDRTGVSGVRGVVFLSAAPDLRGLTPRELDVLGHLVDGASNDEIAHALVVTTRTVATHVEHILAKLSSPSRTHAAVRAQRAGLYVPPAPSPRR